MNLKSDKQLVDEIKQGNILAFEDLVKRYQRGLLAFAYRILRDDQSAQDVVQETLFSFYQTIDRVDADRKISTYIFAIAKNKAISLLRKNKNEVSLEEIIQAQEDEELYEKLAIRQDSKKVKNQVMKLPDKYRQVILLYYFDELSYEEISRQLALPINTVRTHLSRAKKELYEKLKSY